MADPARAAAVLGGIPFIQRLEAKDSGIVKRLAEVALFDSHKKGTVVFRQGDPGSNCYIVVSGEIGVLIYKGKDVKGTPTPRLRFDGGNFPTFGEAGDSAAKADEDDISSRPQVERGGPLSLPHCGGLQYLFCPLHNGRPSRCAGERYSLW